MTRRASAFGAVMLAASAGAWVGCKQKAPPPPPQNTYQVGSLVVNLPPSVSVPLPQGRPDEPTVNQTKCNYVVDKKIAAVAKANPQYAESVKGAKPTMMNECMTKWTQPQYDCMVAAKDLQAMVYCTRFQRP